MGSRVWYEATVACGLPGCPWSIRVEGPEEKDAIERLQQALLDHAEGHRLRAVTDAPFDGSDDR